MRRPLCVRRERKEKEKQPRNVYFCETVIAYSVHFRLKAFSHTICTLPGHGPSILLLGHSSSSATPFWGINHSKRTCTWRTENGSVLLRGDIDLTDTVRHSTPIMIQLNVQQTIGSNRYLPGRLLRPNWNSIPTTTLLVCVCVCVCFMRTTVHLRKTLADPPINDSSLWIRRQ